MDNYQRHKHIKDKIMKKKILTTLAVLFLVVSSTACIFYMTKQKIIVLCVGGPCFPKDQVELAVGVVIDEITRQLGGSSYRFRKKILSDVMKGRGRIAISVMPYGIGPCDDLPDNPNALCDGFRCGSTSESGWCLGRTVIARSNRGGYQSINVQVAKSDDCLARTALVHELLHMFQRVSFGFTDIQHKKSPYWIQTDGENSIEFQVRRTLLHVGSNC